MLNCGVYKITNTKNDKVYIGSSNDIKRRFRDHLSRLREGSSHRNEHLQHAWNKYGESCFTFTVLATCSEPDLANIEQFWMDHYDVTNRDKGYNIRPKADHSIMSEEHKRKISIAQMGNTNGKGYKHTAETRAKMSAAQLGNTKGKGVKCSKETRAKLSAANKGQVPWIKGKYHTDETRAKMSNSKMGENNPNSKTNRLKRARVSLLNALNCLGPTTDFRGLRC